MRHEARGIGAVLDQQGQGFQEQGPALRQQLLAGGTVQVTAAERARLTAALPALAAAAELHAIAAVRRYAHETVLPGEAHWHSIRCAVSTISTAGHDHDGPLQVLVRTSVDGVARRSLGSDVLAGAAAALAQIAGAGLDTIITDLRILAIDVEGRPRHLHPAGLPADVAARLPAAVLPLADIRCALITLSDRAAQGVYEDRSGARLADIVSTAGGTLQHRVILPDDHDRLAAEVQRLVQRGDIDLVLCTGGTGIGPRDITPDTLLALGIRAIPGIAELMRTHSAAIVRSAWLSRAVAGTLGSTVIIALPGSHKAVSECMDVLLPLLPHTFAMLHGGGHG